MQEYRVDLEKLKKELLEDLLAAVGMGGQSESSRHPCACNCMQPDPDTIHAANNPLSPEDILEQQTRFLRELHQSAPPEPEAEPRSYMEYAILTAKAVFELSHEEKSSYFEALQADPETLVFEMIRSILDYLGNNPKNAEDVSQVVGNALETLPKVKQQKSLYYLQSLTSAQQQALLKLAKILIEQRQKEAGSSGNLEHSLAPLRYRDKLRLAEADRLLQIFSGLSVQNKENIRHSLQQMESEECAAVMSLIAAIFEEMT